MFGKPQICSILPLKLPLYVRNVMLAGGHRNIFVQGRCHNALPA